MIKYPEKFVQRVKEAYPGFDALHEALDNGSMLVGRYLDDSRTLEMSNVAIVVAVHRGEQEKVKQAAQRGILREALYRWWLRIVYPGVYGGRGGRWV